MQLVLGVTTNDNNNLTKTFTTKKTVNVKLKEETNIINPTFIINGSITDLADINYCYVADLKRYYFVNEPIVGLGNIVELPCSVDVLMSNKSEILAIKGTVRRAENLSNGYIADDNYKSLAYTNIVTKRFPNAMENDSFILLTVG